MLYYFKKNLKQLKYTKVDYSITVKKMKDSIGELCTDRQAQKKFNPNTILTRSPCKHGSFNSSQIAFGQPSTKAFSSSSPRWRLDDFPRTQQHSNPYYYIGGKKTTRKVHSKLHPGLEWRIFHILTSEDIDDVICCFYTVVAMVRRYDVILDFTQIRNCEKTAEIEVILMLNVYNMTHVAFCERYVLFSFRLKR